MPTTQGDGKPTLSLRPTWLGGDGIHLGDHPFGLDNEKGKDMFAMTMRGVQTSLAVIIVLGILATTIGVVVGALSGYYGKWTDSVLMRFTDVIIVIPLLVITAVAGYALGLEGMWPVAFALGLLTWTGLARLVRAEFLALREREFVDAARVANAPDRRIIFKHILPNTVGTIVVSVTLLMGAGILVEAALGYLGFGVRSPEVSLGTLVGDYDGAYSTRPWLFLWPGIFVITIVLCLQFIGDGMRDAFDPRQKRIPKRKDLEREAAEVRRGDVSTQSDVTMPDDEECHHRQAGRRMPRHLRPFTLQLGRIEMTGCAHPVPPGADQRSRRAGVRADELARPGLFRWLVPERPLLARSSDRDQRTPVPRGPGRSML